MHPIGIVLLIGGGLFSIAGAVFNWDWFMDYNRKSRLIVSLFGRTGGRIFYALIGVTITVFGSLFAVGILK